MTKPTATPENITTLVNEVLKAPEALAALMAAMKATQATEKAANTQGEMDALCIKAFRRAGYATENIQPRTNIKTYNGWLTEGRRVKKGEHAVKVRQLRLFHFDATEPMSVKDKAEALAALEAKKAAKGSTSDKLPKVSPVTAKAKAKSQPKATIVPMNTL